jgi:hypothetical protein
VVAPVPHDRFDARRALDEIEPHVALGLGLVGVAAGADRLVDADLHVRAVAGRDVKEAAEIADVEQAAAAPGKCQGPRDRGFVHDRVTRALGVSRANQPNGNHQGGEQAIRHARCDGPAW